MVGGKSSTSDSVTALPRAKIIFAAKAERDRAPAQRIDVHAGHAAETTIGHLVGRDEQIRGGHLVAAKPAVETTRIRDEER